MKTIFDWYVFHLRRSLDCQVSFPWQKAWWKEQWNQTQDFKSDFARFKSALLVLLLNNLIFALALGSLMFYWICLQWFFGNV